ncbi:hypothetical protein [Roseovarius sp. MMSF_3281]|uniref:hypothetical protein n=1 Tax=Roseovarius sp. MMSF_3281 TaxID=3046694 RepID=UPI00273E4EF3|nr:hypothetical protein [Roseovarius sp. MMSF_3281]
MERRQDAILRQSTNDLLKGIDIRAGLTRGGTFKRGVIPRHLGALAGSLQSTLMGSTAISGTGENSYVMVIGELKGGDRVRFVWGGANAPYAPAIHYGFDSYPGTFWRDDAAAKWQGYVRAATARAKVQIP